MELSQAAAANAQVRRAFKSGRTRSFEWRTQQLVALKALLQKDEGEIAQALYQDLGKSPFESFATEIGPLLNSCDETIKSLKAWMSPQKVSLPLVTLPGSASILAEPLGAVLIFSAWNFPILLALDPVVGAIAAGNALVLKPSEVAPATSSLLAKLIPKYMDPEAITVVEGGVHQCEQLLEQRWDKIFFTGSTRVGKMIMAAAAKHLTPVTLELGGKSPTIVDSTTDLDVAARRIAAGKWGINCGQTCTAPDYILVQRDFAQKLIDALTRVTKEFFGSDPEHSDLTRIVNERHFSRIKASLEDAMTAKAIVFGGGWNEKTLYFEPTILLDPPLDAEVMTEEIFGPILPIVTLDAITDAIDFVNSKEKPLALYLFTKDDNLRKRVIHETSAGGVLVNDTVIHVGIPGIPFGGVGHSGIGKYHGKFSFETFSHMKPVMIRGTHGDVPARYPPYTPTKQGILRHVIRFQYFKLLLYLFGLRK